MTAERDEPQHDGDPSSAVDDAGRDAGYRTVSLLTDYGTDDEFVGLVKSVLRDLAPHATVIDLTHAIPPFDVRAGSLALARCVGYVPEGVVVAVVDPGVGTDRRAVAIEVAGGRGILLGPDNGLLAPAVAMAGGPDRVVELSDERFHLSSPGATFAGRDVFAPVAAHLCNGTDLSELGPEVDPATMMPATIPLPRTEGDDLLAEVLWIDRFGNCQLNLGPDDLDGWDDRVRVVVGPTDPGGPTVRSAVRTTSFADIGGGIGLVLDSYGMLALSMDQRSAADELTLSPGDQVILRPAGDDRAVNGEPGVDGAGGSSAASGEPPAVRVRFGR